MIDVFLRIYPKNDLRRLMGELVTTRLLQMPDISLTLVTEYAVKEPYHINSKKFAEENAQSEIYCVMDDDQLPLREDFCSFGQVILASHLDYGMLSGFPLEYGLQGQPYAAFGAHQGAMIVEAHSIGCPYWVRKGTLKHFPDSAIHFYDGDLSKVVTDQGLKTGLIPGAVYNHLGFGFSQVQHAA